MRSTANQNYEATFNARGNFYDAAMRAFPDARQHEFQTLLKLADLQDGDIVCDVPSGGGYIEEFIKENVHLTLLETSRVFYELCLRSRVAEAVLTKENVMPFGDNHFDKILSLAGIHHNLRQDAFYQECARCLKSGGTLCFADVHQQSPVASFLDVFVNKHNDEGHRGNFLGDHSLKEIADSGLNVEYSVIVSYPWVFTSKEEMARFCRTLFGISRASTSAVVEAISSFVGFEDSCGSTLMNWELFFVRATKPAEKNC